MLLADLSPVYIQPVCVCVWSFPNIHSHMDYKAGRLLMTQVSGHITCIYIYSLTTHSVLREKVSVCHMCSFAHLWASLDRMSAAESERKSHWRTVWHFSVSMWRRPLYIAAHWWRKTLCNIKTSEMDVRSLLMLAAALKGALTWCTVQLQCNVYTVWVCMNAFGTVCAYTVVYTYTNMCACGKIEIVSPVT